MRVGMAQKRVRISTSYTKRGIECKAKCRSAESTKLGFSQEKERV